jgi:signal transduction histidine kinase
MIIGEGIVFVISLLFGIYFIQRAYKKEIDVSRNQNNFLLAVTHELKSPITSINLGLETLMKRDLQKEMVKEISSNTLKESNRLERLINDLLLATKVDQIYYFNRQSIDISEALSDHIDDLHRIRPNVKISYHSEGTVLALVDPTYFITMMSNIIENAIKYGEEETVTVSILKSGNRASIQVCDLGYGIPIKERERVFSKFYRVGSEEVRKNKGTGLGLYIAHKIINGHDGTIEIKDNTPKGTIFEIKLPLA